VNSSEARHSIPKDMLEGEGTLVPRLLALLENPSLTSALLYSLLSWRSGRAC